MSKDTQEELYTPNKLNLYIFLILRPNVCSYYCTLSGICSFLRTVWQNLYFLAEIIRLVTFKKVKIKPIVLFMRKKNPAYLDSVFHFHSLPGILLYTSCHVFCFSNTFTRIEKSSDELYWYEKHKAFNEFHWRYPPPFNVLIYVCLGIKCIVSNFKSCGEYYMKSFNFIKIIC